MKNLVVVIVLGVFIILLGINPVYSQDQDETIELTTYYPAPYGDYHALYTNYIDFNNTDYTESDTPNTPQAIEGRIWYDNIENTFKFSEDGSVWKTLGSGSGGIDVRYASEGDPSGPENGDMWLIIPDPS